MLLRSLKESESGASLVEYALLILLLVLVATPAISLLGKEVNKTYSEVGEAISPNACAGGGAKGGCGGTPPP